MDTKVDHGKHYRYTMDVPLTDKDVVNGFVTVKLDPFRLSKIFKGMSFACETVLKKILVAGGRGNKDYKQDIKDSINALERELEIIEEDEHLQFVKETFKEIHGLGDK